MNGRTTTAITRPHKPSVQHTGGTPRWSRRPRSPSSAGSSRPPPTREFVRGHRRTSPLSYAGRHLEMGGRFPRTKAVGAGIASPPDQALIRGSPGRTSSSKRGDLKFPLGIPLNERRESTPATTPHKARRRRRTHSALNERRESTPATTSPGSGCADIGSRALNERRESTPATTRNTAQGCCGSLEPSMSAGSQPRLRPLG